MLEIDLSEPLVRYLQEQGYTVRCEVADCDLLATREKDLIAIELKRSLNLTLLIQASERQRVADSVYVALPRPPQGCSGKGWRKKIRLLKRLELGLLLVDPESRVGKQVQVVFHPLPFQTKKKKSDRRVLLREMEGRSLDLNRAGSSGAKLMTAYRETAVHIAQCLAARGPLSPKALRGLGTGAKTQSILSNNHYGWFRRVGFGLYDITFEGKAGLEAYPEMALLFEHTQESQEASG